MQKDIITIILWKLDDLKKRKQMKIDMKEDKNQIMNTLKLGHNKCHKDYKNYRSMWKKSQLSWNKQKTNRAHSLLPTFFAFLAFFLVLQKEFLVVEASVYLIWVLPRCHLHLFLSLFVHLKKIRQFQKCVENEHRRVRE
jgi:hypothetical protein